jgi:hypothetical protein
MNGEHSVNRDALLETFAAELTLAAYRVALRTRKQGTWLDLETRPLGGRGRQGQDVGAADCLCALSGE